MKGKGRRERKNRIKIKYLGGILRTDRKGKGRSNKSGFGASKGLQDPQCLYGEVRQKHDQVGLKVSLKEFSSSGSGAWIGSEKKGGSIPVLKNEYSYESSWEYYQSNQFREN